MKKAFTLIELIFVIVIIGILSAVAVPKFLNLKHSAEVNGLIKTTIDVAKNAVNVATNLKYLEGNDSFKLGDLVQLDGRDWHYMPDQPGDTHRGIYYNLPDNVALEIASITLRTDGKIEYAINCDSFEDPKSQEKCKELLGLTNTNPPRKQVVISY